MFVIAFEDQISINFAYLDSVLHKYFFHSCSLPEICLTKALVIKAAETYSVPLEVIGKAAFHLKPDG